jgi:cell wall-associated NlpC family hydrolase
VPVPRPRIALIRSLSVVTLIGLSVGLTAGPGQAAPTPSKPAAPTTSGQAAEQVRKFNFELERVTEQYNDARVLLKKRLAQSATAQVRARSAQAAFTRLSGQVHHIVRSAYQTVPFSRVGAMLTSDSPQDFLDAVTALDAVAGRQAALLARAAKVRTAANKASADARTAVDTANKLIRDLNARKADLTRRVAESKRMFNALSAKERKAVLDDPVPADERASRGTSRQPPAAGSGGSGSGGGGQQAPPVSNVPASGAAAVALATARAQLGKPYATAGAGPGKFDCSGLTMYAWAAAGVQLPHSSKAQIGVGRTVSMSELQPGDLVYFYSPISHVGIYEGNGVMIHAPTPGDVVKRTEIKYLPFAGASRPSG